MTNAKGILSCQLSNCSQSARAQRGTGERGCLSPYQTLEIRLGFLIPIKPIFLNHFSPAVTQPPLSSQRQDPIAFVMPKGREVTVQLVNQTGTTVNYEAIAATDYLPLKAGETKTLSGLNLPTTIALDRGDGGFLQLSTQSQPGLLKVYLYSTNNFNDDEGVLRIQPRGAVYLN